jgi:hypothetical protein
MAGWSPPYFLKRRKVSQPPAEESHGSKECRDRDQGPSPSRAFRSEHFPPTRGPSPFRPGHVVLSHHRRSRIAFQNSLVSVRMIRRPFVYSVSSEPGFGSTSKPLRAAELFRCTRTTRRAIAAKSMSSPARKLDPPAISDAVTSGSRPVDFVPKLSAKSPITTKQMPDPLMLK